MLFSNTAQHRPTKPSTGDPDEYRLHPALHRDSAAHALVAAADDSLDRERPARARLPEASRPETWSDPDLRSLRHLSPGTLRDIGAPDWVHEERHAARERALRLMRL